MGQGNIIGKPNLPATTGSKGLWNLREQYAASRDSKWPGYDPQWANTTLLVKTVPAVAGTNVTPVAVSTIGSPTFGNPGPYAGYSSVTITTNTFQESVNVLDSTMAIGTSDFTVECWVRFNSLTGGVIASSKYASNQNNIYWILAVSSGGKPSFNTRGNAPGGNGFYSDWGATSTDVTLTTGVWYHMAGVRQSGVLKLYIDGTLMNTTQSDSYVPLSEAVVSVGFFNYAGYTAGLNGSVSNFRVTKSAVYTANFSRPTTPVGTIANTVLLLNFDNAPARPIDATGKNTLTSTATVVTTPALFDGTALSFSGSASVTTTATSGNTLAGNFAFGTGDFTIEAWIYPTSASGDRCIFSTRGSDATAVYFGMYTNTYNLGFGTASAWIVTSTVAAPANAWSHVACVRASGVVYLYLNGVCVGSAANTTNLTDAVATVGRSTGNNNFTFIGHLDEVRVTKAARYLGNFTPTTAPFDRDWEPPYNDTLVTSNVLQVRSIDLPAATNNVFRDDSTNAFTVTRNGDVTQGSFSPYIPSGYWSNHFDGNGDFLSRAGNNIVNFGSSNFTVEAWVNLNAMPTSDAWPTNWSSHMVVVECGSVNAGDGNAFIIGQTRLIFHSNDTPYLSENHGMVPGRWYHIALSRSGNTLSFFVNGTAIGTAAFSGAVGTGADTYIGCETSQGAWFNGHISNLRVVNGTALYTASFTPPTTPLTAVTNTSLLTCQDNRFKDNSTNNFALTRNGDVSVSRFDPFPLTVPVTTVATTNPGSVYFDGSGDWLSLPSNAGLALGTSSFTIEMWINPSTVSGEKALIDWRYSGGDSSSTNMITFNLQNGGYPALFSAGAWRITSGTAVTVNAWNHVALCRSGTSTRLFLNGTQVGSTYTDSTNYIQGAGSPSIGAVYDGNLAYTGHISNLRIVKGTALYTTNFTPPTTPLTAVTNTSVLTCQDAATITDASSNALTVTRSGNVTSTDLTPFTSLPKRATYAYGGSGFFDGTGDYLSIPTNTAFDFGTGDFTVEAWVNPATLPSDWFIVSASGSGGLFLGYGAGAVGYGRAGVAWDSGYGGSGVGLAVNAWSHVALSRSGTSIRLFVNGVQAGATATNSQAYNISTGSLNIGSQGANYYCNGYIANVRIVKGTAVYTANFTPPTSPVTAISGTSLLLNFDNAGVYDATGQRSNIVHYGDVKTSTTVTQLGQSVMYFDGTGDYMNVNGPASPALAFGTGDFTIEGWLRPGVAGGGLNILDFRPTYTNGAYPDLYYNGTKLAYYLNGGDAIVGATTIATNTWYHFALCRSGTTTRLFVNGALDASFSDSTNYLCGVNRPMIGGHGYLNSSSNSWNGYLYDLRISRTARYVAPFTPPSEPFPVA